MFIKSRLALLVIYGLATLFLVGCSTPERRSAQRAASFHRLSPADQKLVLHGHIHPGLSRDAVYIAWGPPDWRIDDGKTKQARETWIYERQLSVYAPINSYDHVYPSLGLYGPRFGYGTEPGFGYGGVSNEGFLYPRQAIVTDVRFKRADFVDNSLHSYVVHRGGRTLVAETEAASEPRADALTKKRPTANLRGGHVAVRQHPSHHRGLPIAQRLHRHAGQSGRTAAHPFSRRHRVGDHRDRRPRNEVARRRQGAPL